jgi:hypothetical protein
MVTDPNAEFHYSRLDNESNPELIRLISLHPGKQSDSIICDLEPTSLAQSPSYRALSYCWGGQVPTVDISCNGKCLKITANLATALRHIRKEEEPTFLI